MVDDHESDDPAEPDERDRGLLPPPILRPPGGETLAAPAAPAQHAGAEGLAPPQTGGASQHAVHSESAAGHETTEGVLQRTQSSEAASQHAPSESLQGSGESAARHGDLQPPRPRIRRWLERAAQRPRGVALIAGGVVAVATVAVVVAVQREPDQAEVAAAPSTTTIVVAATPEPGAASAASTAAPRPSDASIAAPTTAAPTTEATSTTVAANSGAGNYAVTGGDVVLEFAETGVSQTVQGGSGPMVLTGACDGVGGCTAMFSVGVVGGADATTPTAGTAAWYEHLDMMPTGDGSYSTVAEVPLDGACSTQAIATVTVSLADGQATGSVVTVVTGTGIECPTVTVTYTFTAVRDS